MPNIPAPAAEDDETASFAPSLAGGAAVAPTEAGLPRAETRALATAERKAKAAADKARKAKRED